MNKIDTKKKKNENNFQRKLREKFSKIYKMP